MTKLTRWIGQNPARVVVAVIVGMTAWCVLLAAIVLRLPPPPWIH